VEQIDASGSDAPFRAVAIAGVGLIGGSIALGLRERWPSCRIVGVDRRSVLAHAVSSGAVDRAVDSLDEIGDVDLIVLAAPVSQNVELLAQVARRASASTLITDVGGTKRDIMEAAERLPAPGTFVGGHPIGGAERGGFGFARPDLFKGRPWIFTPGPKVEKGSLERLFTLAEGLGARPVVLDPERHDRLMAFLSHLPQLTASALMQVAGAGATDGLRLAGRGLVDTTRLASSPPDVWRDICAANADAIGEALDQLIAALSELRAGLGQGDVIDALFNDAGRWRAELMKSPAS
jgi:prephenate dehydrogenase